MPVQDTLYENCDGDFVSDGGEVASQAKWSWLVSGSAVVLECQHCTTMHHDKVGAVAAKLSSYCRVNALCSLLNRCEA